MQRGCLKMGQPLYVNECIILNLKRLLMTSQYNDYSM